jgi:flagellar protein FliT
MTRLLNHYESVAEASGRMLAAARRGDWDALVAAEHECASRVETLRAASAGQSLAGAERERKMQIIREVLRHDAEIRELAMPWMAKLQSLIGAGAVQRRVNDAYGASQP